MLHLLPSDGGGGVHSHTICMEARVHWDSVVVVDLVNLTIQPVDLFFLIMIIKWLSAIVSKPGKFGGVHHQCNGTRNV